MNIIDEAMASIGLSDDKHSVRNYDEVRAAIEHAVRRCAKIIFARWTPSVGGFPDGEEIAKAILDEAGLE